MNWALAKNRWHFTLEHHDSLYIESHCGWMMLRHICQIGQTVPEGKICWKMELRSNICWQNPVNISVGIVRTSAHLARVYFPNVSTEWNGAYKLTHALLSMYNVLVRVNLNMWHNTSHEVPNERRWPRSDFSVAGSWVPEACKACRAAAQRNIYHSAAELQGIPGLISKCEAALNCRIPVFTVPG